MMEALFAQAHQGRTFLLMALAGAALALGVQLSGLMHRRNRPLGLAADLLLAAGIALALCRIVLHSGEGLRGYGLLGLLIGATLYAWGIGPLVRWAGRMVCRRAPKASP